MSFLDELVDDIAMILPPDQDDRITSPSYLANKISEMKKDLNRKEQELSKQFNSRLRNIGSSETRRTSGSPSPRSGRRQFRGSFFKRSRSRDSSGSRGRRRRRRSRSQSCSMSRSRSPNRRRRRRSISSNNSLRSAKRRSRSKEGNRSKNVPFIEEIKEKLARTGQSLPEADLMLNAQYQNVIHHPISYPVAGSSGMIGYEQPLMAYNNSNWYGSQQGIIPQPVPPPQVAYTGEPFYEQPNMMSISAPVPINNQIPMPQSIHERQVMQPTMSGRHNDQNSHKSKILSRCSVALNLLRNEESNAPKKELWYTRTIVTDGSDVNSSFDTPLRTIKHPKYNFKRKGMTMPEIVMENFTVLPLSKKTSLVCSVLGMNAKRILRDIKEMNSLNRVTAIVTSEAPEPVNAILPGSYDVASQTSNWEGLQVATQTDNAMMTTTYTQTNEIDYREPLVGVISRLNPAQLTAMSDFARVLQFNPPQNERDALRMKERLSDIYNLAHREAVIPIGNPGEVNATAVHSIMNNGPPMVRENPRFIDRGERYEEDRYQDRNINFPMERFDGGSNQFNNVPQSDEFNFPSVNDFRDNDLRSSLRRLRNNREMFNMDRMSPHMNPDQGWIGPPNNFDEPPSDSRFNPSRNRSPPDNFRSPGAFGRRRF